MKILLLGYYISNRFYRELELIKEVSNAFDSIVIPNSSFKLGFPNSIALKIRNMVTVNTIIINNISKDVFCNANVLVFSRNDALISLKKIAKNVTYLESYGGYDLKYYRSIKYIPKSAYSFYFNQPPYNFLSDKPNNFIGPIWYKRNQIKSSINKVPRIGLFTKNIFFLKDKAIKWRGERIGIYFYEEHLKYILQLIEIFPEICIFPHPNNGGYEDQEREWFIENGVDESRIFKDSNDFKKIDIGVGFTSFSRVDLNWFGIPFIEISDLKNIERNYRMRGFLSKHKVKKPKDCLVVGSNTFSPFYGFISSISKIKDDVEFVSENYNSEICTRVGEILLGPDLSMNDRKELIIKEFKC